VAKDKKAPEAPKTEAPKNSEKVADAKVDLLVAALLAWQKAGAGFTHATNWGETIGNAIAEFVKENTGVADATLVWKKGMFQLVSESGTLLLQTESAWGMARGLLRSDGKKH